MKEWFIIYWKQILSQINQFGKFGFTILPLLKNPLFILGTIFIAFILLMFRLLRILSIYIGIFILVLTWSFFIAPYGCAAAVPFAHWWILISIGIGVIGIEFYLCLIIIE